MRNRIVISCLFGLFTSVATAQWNPPEPPDPPKDDQGEPVVETDNRRELGKVLFWDEQLSSDMSTACGTCHLEGGSDPRAKDAHANGAVHPGHDGAFGTDDDVNGSPGIVRQDASGSFLAGGHHPFREQVTNRRAPSFYNSAFFSRLFWDGRTNSSFRDPETGEMLLPVNAALENLALEPLLNPVEMAHEGRTAADIVERVSSIRPLAMASEIGQLAPFVGSHQHYAPLFNKAFGDPEITAARIAFALASYMRSLNSSDTPADRFILGFTHALTPRQRLGHDLFFGKGNCSTCHEAPLFGSSTAFNTGVRPPHEDPGQGALFGPAANGRFKTPSLRNVGLRAPYFHNGGAETLEEVVEFYDRGGDFQENISPLMEPLGLTDLEKEALVDFLRFGLTDKRVEFELPPFDRPKLASERTVQPKVAAFGSPGAGGPLHIEAGPAFLSRKNYTIGLYGGIAGMPAVLGVTTSAPGAHDGSGATLGPGVQAFERYFFGGALQGQGVGDGHTQLQVDLPLNPALHGLKLFMTWYALDPTTAEGLATSPTLKVEFFMPRGL